MGLVFYDFEVTKYDWLVVFEIPNEPKVEIDNDEKALLKFYEEHKNDIFIGYNNSEYDQYIYKGILCGFNPYEINDFIINKNMPGYRFSGLFREFPMINYDVRLGITDRGLKVLEGFMGNMIKETDVSFDIDRPLTKKEKKLMFYYCGYDVRQTIEVFMERIDEFNTLMFFIKHFKLPISYISKTKSQLASIILGGNNKYSKLDFNDEFYFPIVECLELEKYRFVADWYLKEENKNYQKSQNVVVAGVPHTFSWGGGHGAIKKYHSKGVFIIIDVTAYYPSLQEKFKFGYRVMNNPENFEFIHNSNIEYKKLGDKKKRQPFKIMDNAISGQMKQKISALYDPMSNNSICVNGQLLLLDLVEHLENTNACKLIQNNTDGIILEVIDYDKSFDLIDDTVFEWEKRTGMKMGFDLFFGEIYQKDVNNYVLFDNETGEIKSKGAYVKKLSRLDYDLPIVNKSLINYMVRKIPIEKTIMECDDLIEFQMIKKIGSKYEAIFHNGIKLNEKCVRIFADKNQGGGLQKLHKLRKNYAKLEGTPANCFIDNSDVTNKKIPANLDKQWYIDLALKRLGDFYE